MHIALIGMPGAGKSTVGRRLADELGYLFLDPDRIMEDEREQPLPAVLAALGAEAFLKAESEVVMACADADGPCVISPGGSIVYSEEAMKKLSRTAVIVHLDAPLSILESRIGSEPRGIVGEKTLAELYTERAPLYRAWAAWTVPADQDVDAVTAQIMADLSLKKEYGGSAI